jgi:hypothetical protein
MGVPVRLQQPYTVIASEAKQSSLLAVLVTVIDGKNLWCSSP